jgi:GT2 family glycosyltransferase
VQGGWIAAASAFLAAHPDVAVVCGRRRERFPEVSVYNRLCDREWDRPVGETRSCGGDALIRARAFAAVGGYDGRLIAGEEPEMCVRLRAGGWRIWRLGEEMTLHDAAMTRFGQWWKRVRRSGHAYAEGAALHGASGLGVAGQRRAVAWGMVLPLVTLAALAVTPWGSVLLLAWPLQVLRLGLRSRFARETNTSTFARETNSPFFALETWEEPFFLTLGKFPEAMGVAEYHLRRLVGRRAGLIEYK